MSSNLKLMKKLLIIVFGLSSILQSCKDYKAKEVSLLSQNKASTDFENSDLTEQPNYYCKVKIGKDECITTDYLMSSSNAARKESILILFGITLNEAMEEKYQLDISLQKRHNTLDPKLKIGSYPLFAIMSDAEDYVNGFQFLGNVIGEKTYEQAKNENILEDLEGSYVLLLEHTNTLNIKDVMDLDVEQDQPFYTTGKQRVKGEVNFNLLRVDINEKLTVNIDFDIEHEWALSK